MNNKIVKIFKKIPFRTALPIAGVVLIVLLSILLLWHGNANSNQSIPAPVGKVYFAGEYRIGDGEWKDIVKGEHISSTKGDVTLRGNFHELTPDGEYVGVYRGVLPIAFYINHISLTFFEVGREPYVFDMENPTYGKSNCGARWEAHDLTSESDELIEITVTAMKML